MARSRRARGEGGPGGRRERHRHHEMGWYPRGQARHDHVPNLPTGGHLRGGPAGAGRSRRRVRR
eukprot:4565697-Pyramimonas_sp.AAC.1